MASFLKFFLTAAFIVASLSADWQQPPEQFTTPPTASQDTTGATDGNGNAIAVWLDGSGVGPQASYYTNGSWGTTHTFGGAGDGLPKVAMDASGTGLVIYSNFITNNIETSYFNAGAWTVPPPNPLDTVSGLSNRQAIAMNGTGRGVAVWNDTTAGSVRSSFFSSGSWTAPTTIGGGAGLDPSPNSVAYSSNGTAVAIWTDFSNNAVVATVYNGVSWQPVASLGSSTSFSIAGIDSSGNALAAWIDLSGNVTTSIHHPLTASWTPSQIIAAAPGNTGISLAVAPGGTGVLTWQDSANNGFSSSYNGTAFGAAQQFGSSLASGINISAGVSVDSAGNALVVFESSATSQILSSTLSLGGTWSAPLIIKDLAGGPSPGSPYVSALSTGGRGFAFWTELDIEEELPTSFASAFIPPIVDPLPPVSITGSSCTNKFATQTVYVNRISWIPSPDPTVAFYYLRRNGILIAMIQATGPYQYVDHTCKKETDSYSLTSVNALGNESTQVSIIL